MSELIAALAEVLARRKGMRWRRRGARWVNPLQVKRVLIDGQELLVREVLQITPDEIVVVDLDGTVKTIPRRRAEKSLPLTSLPQQP